jgi:hypothetical protein
MSALAKALLWPRVQMSLRGYSQGRPARCARRRMEAAPDDDEEGPLTPGLGVAVTGSKPGSSAGFATTVAP